MRLALLQLNATIGAYDANRAKLEAAYRDAVARGAELVLAPELYLCGYPAARPAAARGFSRARIRVPRHARPVGR
ncbi:MAG: nitrilase-related carbon-nitrogen hydrolase [Verrucomicrobiota bacterium]